MMLVQTLLFGIAIGSACNSAAAGFAAFIGFVILGKMLEEFCQRVERAINALGEIEDEEPE